jgi:hypothetical protein
MISKSTENDVNFFLNRVPYYAVSPRAGKVPIGQRYFCTVERVYDVVRVA